MEILINNKKLFNSLNKIIGVVDRRTVVAANSYFLFRIAGGKLKIYASDGSTEMNSSMNLDLIPDRDVSFTLPARKLYEICRNIEEDEDISIELLSGPSDQNPHSDEEIAGLAMLKTQSFSYKLAMLPHESFATIDDMGSDTDRTSVWVEASEFKQMLQKALASISLLGNASKPYMNGLTLHVQSDNKLRGIALDGLRMSHLEIKHQSKIERNLSIVIPRKTVTELTRVIESNEKEIHLDIGRTYFRIISTDFILITKLIDANVPNQMGVVPNNLKNQFKVSTYSLLAMLTRSMVVLLEKEKLVTLDINSDKLCARAENLEKESLTEFIPIDYSGEDAQIILNATHFRELLMNIDSEKAEIFFADNKTNAMLRDMSKDNDWHVLAPYVHSSEPYDDEDFYDEESLDDDFEDMSNW